MRSAKHTINVICRTTLLAKCDSQRNTRSDVNDRNNSDNSCLIDKTVDASIDNNYISECESNQRAQKTTWLQAYQVHPSKLKPETQHYSYTNIGFLIDSGSVFSIMNESLAPEIIKIVSLAKWLKNRLTDFCQWTKSCDKNDTNSSSKLWLAFRNSRIWSIMRWSKTSNRSWFFQRSWYPLYSNSKLHWT